MEKGLTISDLIAKNKKEYNSIVAKYMGGEIHPFKMPDGNNMLWQNCEIKRINGCDRDSDLWFEKDWNAIVQVLQKIAKENFGKLYSDVSLEESACVVAYKEAFGCYNIEGTLYYIVKYIECKNKQKQSR